jgi:hypothetical protein
MRNMAVYFGRWSALALCLSFCGCTAISDCKYECSQKIRTCQAWHQFDGCNDECFTGDYRSGWKAGYYAVLTGDSGCPPLIAPKRYWNPPVFCEHDPNRRNDWYCGYQDGVACARCEPDHHYLQVWSPCAPVCCQSQTITQPVIRVEVPVGGPEASVPGESISTPVTPDVPVLDITPGGSEASEAPSLPEPTAPKPPEYEKDPDPSMADSETPDDWITQALLTRQPGSEAQAATHVECSYVLRLIDNAAADSGQRAPLRDEHASSSAQRLK